MPKTEKEPVTELIEASKDLKARIAEAKTHNAMPLDSALGNPEWEKKAADGHLDVADDDDE